MIIDKDKINDPNLTEEEDKIILKAFLRRLEKEKNVERWRKVLADKYDLHRPVTEPARTSTIRRLILPIIGIAAAVLFLVFALPRLMTTDGQELLAQYETETMVISYRSPEDNPAAVLREVLIASFVDGDYPAAQQAGRELVASPDSQPEDLLNLGLAYLRDSDYPEAESVFRQLLTTGDAFKTEANFYLALCLLQQGETEAGLTMLRTINPEEGGRFHGKASELLRANWE